MFTIRDTGSFATLIVSDRETNHAYEYYTYPTDPANIIDKRLYESLGNLFPDFSEGDYEEIRRKHTAVGKETPEVIPFQHFEKLMNHLKIRGRRFAFFTASNELVPEYKKHGYEVVCETYCNCSFMIKELNSLGELAKDKQVTKEYTEVFMSSLNGYKNGVINFDTAYRNITNLADKLAFSGANIDLRIKEKLDNYGLGDAEQINKFQNLLEALYGLQFAFHMSHYHRIEFELPKLLETNNLDKAYAKFILDEVIDRVNSYSLIYFIMYSRLKQLFGKQSVLSKSSIF